MKEENVRIVKREYKNNKVTFVVQENSLNAEEWVYVGESEYEEIAIDYKDSLIYTEEVVG